MDLKRRFFWRILSLYGKLCCIRSSKKGGKIKWRELCEEALELIARKLSYSDLVSFAAVCAPWREAAKRSSRLILLTVSGNQTDVIVTDFSKKPSLCLRRLADSKVSCEVANLVVSLREPDDELYCIGSSKDMLVLSDRVTQTRIILINRFSQETIRLPPLFVANDVDRPCYNWVMVYIAKAVVLTSTSNKNKKSGDKQNIVLAAICYCSRPSITYYQGGSWAMLDKDRAFVDILASESRLFALSESGSVEAWHFGKNNSHAPSKVISFVPSEKLPNTRSHFVNQYLVESMGKFLLVRKLVSPNKCDNTVEFQVYKCCLGVGESWKKVDSLGGDRALFLGRNESVSVSVRELPEGCEGNSIYFTDYQIMRIYGGVDIGVYSLKNKKVKLFSKLNDGDDLEDPVPLWMIKTDQSD